MRALTYKEHYIRCIRCGCDAVWCDGAWCVVVWCSVELWYGEVGRCAMWCGVVQWGDLM